MESFTEQELNKCRIAFVGWNPFQFVQYLPLAKAFPGAVFVVELRPNNNINEFEKSFLEGEDIPVLIWERRDMKLLDGMFDVVVAQTEFMHIHLLQKTKLVFLQYGCAKEPHNYGTWRSLADLCLTYGDYSSSKVETFCPAVATGNPRYDALRDDDYLAQIEEKFSPFKDPEKPTILYMPTWGGLSSVNEYFKHIMELADDYNLFIKLHHNTYILEKNKVKPSKGQSVKFFDLHDDGLELIVASDIVISDYSGAIFDALYFRKRIALLDIDMDNLEEESKIDTHSIEFARRDDLGLRVQNPHALRSGINNLAQAELNIDEDLRSNLFLDSENYVMESVKAILHLLASGYTKTQAQTYIRDTVVDNFDLKRELAITKTNKKQ